MRGHMKTIYVILLIAILALAFVPTQTAAARYGSGGPICYLVNHNGRTFMHCDYPGAGATSSGTVDPGERTGYWCRLHPWRNACR